VRFSVQVRGFAYILAMNIIQPLRKLAIPIDGLHPDPANARQHSERNIDAIKASLAKFGQRLPIVVQREGMIIRAGNARLEAAKQLGWTEIAAVTIDETDIEAVAFAIADNRTAELAEWDDDILAKLLIEVKESPDIDEMVAGFDETEMNDIFLNFKPEHLKDQPRLDEKKKITCPECGHEFTP